MRSFSELTHREQLIEIARWFCVLPAAVFGEFAVSFLVMAVARIASYGGLGMLGDSSFAYWCGLFLSHGPQKAAFVIMGAMVAPRRKVATAIALAVLGLGLSLMTHVVG